MAIYVSKKTRGRTCSFLGDSWFQLKSGGIEFGLRSFVYPLFEARGPLKKICLNSKPWPQSCEISSRGWQKPLNKTMTERINIHTIQLYYPTIHDVECRFTCFTMENGDWQVKQIAFHFPHSSDVPTSSPFFNHHFSWLTFMAKLPLGCSSHGHGKTDGVFPLGFFADGMNATGNHWEPIHGEAWPWASELASSRPSLPTQGVSGASEKTDRPIFFPLFSTRKTRGEMWRNTENIRKTIQIQKIYRNTRMNKNDYSTYYLRWVCTTSRWRWSEGTLLSDARKGQNNTLDGLRTHQCRFQNFDQLRFFHQRVWNRTIGPRNMTNMSRFGGFPK